MRTRKFTTINPKRYLNRFDIKKIIKLILFTVLFHSIQAQNKGIKFEHHSNWQSILTKAKAENKYIFVDCFTTWCGPCRFMSENVFTLEDVGNFFNSKFINVKFQLDSTSDDNEEIKRKYGDAVFIKNEYQINGYPTYLFFNPNGELVNRELGSCNENEFITKGVNSLDTQKQYYTQIKKYNSGDRNAIFLKNLALLAFKARDESATTKYAKEYFSTKPDLLSTENLQFVLETTLNVKDTGFSLIINNLSKFESVIDKKKLRNNLLFIIKRSEFLENNKEYKNWDKKKWDNYENFLDKEYPLYADEVLLQIKTIIFQNKIDWNSYAATVEKYVAKHRLANTDLNEYAWILFKKCNDKKILKKALKWSKMSFTDQVKIEPSYIDTYANLLYKIGKKKKALSWEVKAQQILIKKGLNTSWEQKIIEKMKKGEKTW